MHDEKNKVQNELKSIKNSFRDFMYPKSQEIYIRKHNPMLLFGKKINLSKRLVSDFVLIN